MEPIHLEVLEPPEGVCFTHFVDACVDLDFGTTITLMKNQHAPQHSIDASIRAMRDATWTAMALDEQSAVTLTLQCEAADKTLNEAPPGTYEGQWTAVSANIVRPHVVPRWCPYFVNVGRTIRLPDGTERKTDNNERDQVMVDLAKRENLVIVTADKGALARARAAGLKKVFKPAEYAASVMSLVVARDRFMERFDRACGVFLKATGGGIHGHENLSIMWEAYESLWNAV